MQKLRRALRAWRAIRRFPEVTRKGVATAFKITPAIRRVRNFGYNPGNLRMFKYMPARRLADPALVVVLHGSGQTATSYAYGAGWMTLADRCGFGLLLPQQKRSNNPHRSFNWFLPRDARRGRGEAASIAQMIKKMADELRVGPDRVFITGLSAGGAMTSVMLACYPELFAAGAIIAGLPYGAASNLQEAFRSMLHCPSRSADEWGAELHAAADWYAGPWPRLSVWHGDADKIVNPSNSREILKQWTNVHGFSLRPTLHEIVGGHPREVWLDDDRVELIESYTIRGMAHGAPIAAGSEYGFGGPFLFDVGISSSFLIAKFFGLTSRHYIASDKQRASIRRPNILQRGTKFPGRILRRIDIATAFRRIARPKARR